MTKARLFQSALPIGRAALSGLAKTMLRPVADPTWSRGQQLWVHVLRDLLMRVKDCDGAYQRSVLGSPVALLPKDITETKLTLGQQTAYRWTPLAASSKHRLIHFHGGGYVIGDALHVRSYVCQLARGMGIPAVSVNYRLAPEHPYPAAIDDGEAAVQAVLDQGIAPQNILLAGDSAGGNLALATLLRFQRLGVRLGGAILGSPWVDLSMPGASVQTNASLDYLQVEVAAGWAEMYAAGQLGHPEVSPSHAEFHGLPPIHLAIGDAECLRDDQLSVAERMRAAGVEVDVNLAAGSVHCWYIQAGLPGTTDAVDHMVAFGRRTLKR